MKRGTAQKLTKSTLRELRGPYSQLECARAIGVTPTTVQDWDAGKSQPSPPSLRKLLDHYTLWQSHYRQDPQPLVDSVIKDILPQTPVPTPNRGT